VIWPGALIQEVPLVSSYDVEGRFLSSNVLSRRPSGTGHGSSSHLTFREVLYLTYIIRRIPAYLIQQEYGFSFKTIADGVMFSSSTLLAYVEGYFQNIGGPNKTA